MKVVVEAKEKKRKRIMPGTFGSGGSGGYHTLVREDRTEASIHMHMMFKSHV
jgi:hypothetical protein